MEQSFAMFKCTAVSSIASFIDQMPKVFSDWFEITNCLSVIIPHLPCVRNYSATKLEWDPWHILGAGTQTVDWLCIFDSMTKEHKIQ